MPRRLVATTLVVVAWLGATRAARAVPRLSIEGTTTCPTAAAVTAALDELMPAAPDGVPEVRLVRLARKGTRVQLSLVDLEGRALARRELSATAGCTDLARAAAVVVASWQLELAEEMGAPAMPRLVLPSPPALQAPAAPVVPAPPASRSAPVGLHLGAAVGAAAGVGPSGAWVPQGGVGARLFRDGRRLGAASELWATGARALALGKGEARQRRVALCLGPALRGSVGRLEADATLGLVAAWLHLEGRGLARDRSVDVLDPGARLGLRLAVRASRFVPWVGVSGLGWFVRRTATLAPANTGDDVAARPLPRGELVLALGVDIRLRP